VIGFPEGKQESGDIVLMPNTVRWDVYEGEVLTRHFPAKLSVYHAMAHTD